MGNLIIIVVVAIIVVVLLRIIFKIGKKLIIILLAIGLALATYSYFKGGEGNKVTKFIDEKISTLHE